MSKRDEAKKIIDKYAKKHAFTGWVVGQFGGQFGLDKAPLTALTVSMIKDLCKLYGIHDEASLKSYIESAFGMFTTTGTAVSHTLLNWIPFVGPAANSMTISSITKAVGLKCIAEIEKNLIKNNLPPD